MKNQQMQTIYLSVDRHEQLILVDTILYAQVTDKLCTIYFTQGRPIHVFITLSALSGMLPEDDFKQISRSCLVALKYVKNITDRSVVMSNGAELPYTYKKKTSILLAFQQNLALRAKSHEAISWRLDFSSEFRCFDRCPIPFFVLEKAVDSPQEEPHYIYRYANEAMAAFRRSTLEALISSVFVPATEYNGSEHLNMLSDVALGGGMRQWYEKSSVTGTRIHVISYQPHYGFCACFLFPVEE